MPRDRLAYWKPKTAAHNLEVGGALNHAASNQFHRVEEGDTVWLVFVRSGELLLLGGIKVGQVTDSEGAALALGTRDLYESDHHILAANGTAHPIQEIPITHLASRLRFESKGGSDRLKIEAGHVNPQQLQTMRVLTQDSAEMLRETLGHAVSIEESAFTLPEEVSETSPLVEGAVHRISVNAYERNPVARRRCIDWHGTNCCICGFSFGAVYGALTEGYIHVHHLRLLSEIGGEYIVDPVEDLRPVCPNCHAVLHSRVPAYSIEEVRSFLRARD